MRTRGGRRVRRRGKKRGGCGEGLRKVGAEEEG